MCGIAGIFRFNSFTTKEDKEALNRMTALLKYRGPDDEGIYEDDHCIIGHRRLAVIDLEGGKQPMVNDKNSVVLAHNGEIYNYRQLRDILIKEGHIFCTQYAHGAKVGWLRGAGPCCDKLCFCQ